MNSPKLIQFLLAVALFFIILLFLPPYLATFFSILIFIALAWYRPKYFLLLIITYFSFRPALVEINEGLKLAGDIGIITLVIKVVFEALRQKDYRSIFKLEWYEWAYLLFCLVGTISALFTGVKLIAIIFQLRKFLVMYLLFYAIKRLKWEKENVLSVLKTITVIALVLSIHGYIEKISQRQWLLPQTWKEMYLSSVNIDRIYGLLGNPNSLALFMFVAIVASLILLQITKKKYWYIPCIVSVGTLILTLSRGTWLTIIIAGIIYIISTRKFHILGKAAIALIAGYLLIFLPVSYGDEWVIGQDKNVEDNEEKKINIDGTGSKIGDRIGSMFKQDEITASQNTGRLYFVKVGFEIFRDYPIIGTGFGTFGDSATLIYSSPIYEEYNLAGIYHYLGRDFYSDNQYIQVIVQTGIVGTILFTIFLLNLFYRMIKLRKIHREEALLGLLFYFVIVLVGVVYNVWENQMFAMFFFILLGWLETLKTNNSVTFSSSKKEVLN